MVTLPDIHWLICEIAGEQISKNSNILFEKFRDKYHGYFDTDMQITVPKTFITNIVMCNIAFDLLESI